MKKIFLVALSLVLAISLAACNGTKKATAYGLVHGHYVGEAVIEVDSKGVVKDIKFEEYFLPYNWAKVATPTDLENIPADVLAVVGSRGTSYYAKYVKVGDKLFTGAVTGASGSQSIVYSATGIDNIENWVKTSANGKWYVEQVKANAFFLATATGAQSTTLTRSDATSNKAMSKSESGYWTVEAPALGWKGNMAKIVEVIVGSKLDVAEAEIVKVGESKFWTVGDVVSGATLSDFKDYYRLAKVAYDLAK